MPPLRPPTSLAGKCTGAPSGHHITTQDSHRQSRRLIEAPTSGESCAPSAAVSASALANRRDAPSDRPVDWIGGGAIESYFGRFYLFYPSNCAPLGALGCTMTKNEFIDAVADKSEVPQPQVKQVYDAMFGPDGVLVTCMTQRDRLVLPGFGTFHTTKVKAHERHHPSTKAHLTVDARLRMHFKPGTALDAALKNINPE